MIFREIQVFEKVKKEKTNATSEETNYPPENLT